MVNWKGKLGAVLAGIAMFAKAVWPDTAHYVDEGLDIADRIISLLFGGGVALSLFGIRQAIGPSKSK
jgi:hypothetical protein